jgi:site-specific recombinase XerD
VHHFAFVRSSLLGLDLAEAFNRYLAWSETTTDLRHVQHRRDALLKHIIACGRQFDATREQSAKITPLINLLRSNVPTKPAVVLPNLDEWIESEGMDPQDWSEADLLAEYKAAFNLDNAVDQDAAEEGAKDAVGDRVRALNYLETVLSVIPTAPDRLDSWFASPVAKCLRNVGLVTLCDLVCFINKYGYGWHSLIKGMGKERARQVLAWLVLEQEHLHLQVSDDAFEPKSKRELRVADLLLVAVPASPSLSQFGAGTRVAAELAHIQCSADLAGSLGDFRSHMANTLGARNDLEAVNAWLACYSEKPHTLRSYRKEVERFLLWCAKELKKPLSSVNVPDCQRYREFLQAVPASWMERLSVKRTDPLWRAFRSQPGPASQKQALVILQSMYAGLVDAGYLVANPMRVLMKSIDLPPNKIDIRRSFTDAEWSHVLMTLDAMRVGPQRLRLKCILELLVTSGIRLDELARARHKDMRIEALADLAPTWTLMVTGKRNKAREVPLNPDILKLLALHAGEFVEEDKSSTDQANLPLIRTLRASVPRWCLGENGQPRLAAMSQRPGAALSAGGIYDVLKAFFRKAAKTATHAGLDARRFKKASTHWMRHTFVRQALVDGMPIEIAGALAGHVSLDTTSIYSTQELSRKIRAVQVMTRRFAQ